MTLESIQQTYAWQEAIELARPISRLSEELPSHEQGGLVRTLQAAMVDLPASIGVDLLKGARTRMPVILRLEAALEIIDRVYPALDTLDVRAGLEQLLAITETGRLYDLIPAPEQLPLEDEDEDDDDYDDRRGRGGRGDDDDRGYRVRIDV